MRVLVVVSVGLSVPVLVMDDVHDTVEVTLLVREIVGDTDDVIEREGDTESVAGDS